MVRTPWLWAWLSCAVVAQVPEDHPVRHDRTGIAWQVPFATALAKAKAQQRLLVIKPVAFGTTADGCW